MIRSMFTAISSLNLQQKYLDVVSNNLANANTSGFKASRVLSQDQFSQMMSPGSAPTATQGGVNPTQVGLGVNLGYISPNFTQGVLQGTGRNMDLGIQGDGFFIYGTYNRRYSREGSMSLDSEGNLVNSATGMRTQGWMADPTTGLIDTDLPVDDINIVTDKTLAKATTEVTLGGNLSASTAAAGTNTISMGVYDSLGSLRTASITFTRQGAGAPPVATNVWDWSISSTPAGASGSGTVTFDANGQVTGSTIGAAITIPGSAGSTSPISPLTIDFTKLTQLVAANSATVTTQDGLRAGNVTDVYI